MARMAAIGAPILIKACQFFLNRTSVSLILNQHNLRTPIQNSRCGHRIISNLRYFCSGKRIDHNIMQEPRSEQDLQAISETRIREGEGAESRNLVFGSTVIDGATGEWLTLNRMMNSYPSVRRFTAIGLGGDDFVQSMVVAVESVIQHHVPQDHVKQRVSSGGKYVSVNIGPVRVISKEQVQAVYNAMRSDDRMKFFL